VSLFEINKIAGALLAAMLTAGIATTISNLVYPDPHVPEVLLAVPASDDAPAPSADAPATPESVPIADRLAAADPAKGEREAKKCAACHTFASGEPARVGPNLYGLVDRPIAASDDFRYSPAMTAQGGAWTYDDLDAFLAGPKAYVPGTSMAFAGVRDPAARAAIIAWLRLQADAPAPLPTP